MRSKLSPSDWASVVQMAAAGKTSAEIEDTLRRRGLTIHQSNIRRYLAKHRAETVQTQTAQEELDSKARAFLSSYGSLPEVPRHIRTTRIEEMGFDTPQPAIALFSDLHYGSRIDPRATGGLAEYNIDIARERLARWRNALLRFHQMDSVLVDVPSLHIFALGDDLEGHGNMFPTQALQMDESVLFQYMGFVEDITGVLLALLERYPRINVYKVYGNHGRISDTAKASYPPDNLEIMAWEHIADRVRSKVGGEWSTSRTGIHSLTGGLIEFHISRSFFILAEIEGQLIYARHGHKIGGLNRTYTGAYDNKLRMNPIVSDRRLINFMFKAHLHEAQEMEGEIGGQVVQNGCFVGPSLLSIEGQRASASLPSQEMYLIHPKYGLTHHHRIRLATPDELRQGEMVRNADEAIEVVRVVS
jgi:hypothetical protein